MEPRLRLINISKQFGALHALQNISFEVFPGEVVGVVGRSGSGKSVLAALLAGQYPPTSGDIYLGAERLQLPQATRPLGIEIIHQEPILADALDITSNLFLGREILRNRWLGIPDRLRMDEEAQQILQRLELRLPSLRENVANLTAEARQLLAIGRALVATAPVLIIDDPTALLSYTNQQKLLSLIQDWQQQGTSILFTSDNLDHLFAVTDRLIVLQQGHQIAQHRTDETSREEVVAELLDSTDRRHLTPALWALDSYYRYREQAEKLRHQQRLLEQNLAVQGSLNQELIEQLDKQVKALDRANLALQDANRRMLTQREDERKYLARELHDQLIQDLLGINYQLESLVSQPMGALLTAAPPETTNEMVDIRERIGMLIDDLRRICGDLRPPTIDSLGLGAAMQSYVRDWAGRTGVQASLTLDVQLGRLPEEMELSLFRIMQESLSNVRKHARATHVSLSLEHTSPRMVRLAVQDNGRGLPHGVDLSVLSAQGHYGLLGVSERVALMQGRLQLQNLPAGGLRVEVELPHPRVPRNGQRG